MTASEILLVKSLQYFQLKIYLKFGETKDRILHHCSDDLLFKNNPDEVNNVGNHF